MSLDPLHRWSSLANSDEANILINHECHARIADFGLAAILNQTGSTSLLSRAEGGTFQWMSPELFNPGKFGMEDDRPTKESDCYALGMVIYEVLSGQVPFPGLKGTAVVCKVIEGERPGRPRGRQAAWFSDDLWEMLELCWKPQPCDRPDLDAILKSLERITQPSRPPSPSFSPSPSPSPTPIPSPTTNEDEEADSDDQLDFTVINLGTLQTSPKPPSGLIA